VTLTGHAGRVAALVLAAACWGIGTAVSKQAVAEVPPLTLLALQLAASVGFLAIVLRARGERVRPADRDALLLGRLGLLNPGFAYALSLIGLTQISASLSVVLWAFEPMLILALAALFLGERIGLAIVVASATAVAGLALAVFDPSASGSLLGVGLTVGGVLVCALYTVATRRWLPRSTDSTFGIVLLQQLHALGLAIGVLSLVGIAGWPVFPANVTGAALLSTIASGLLYYAFAYWFYLSALRSVPAAVAAASFYLIPLFGIAAGWLFGERLQPLQWIGALLVVGSVAVITGRRRGTTAAPSAAAA
jgi:drug/metabolite transporter (DMT)-like permease